MQVLYFAWLREKIGTATEDIPNDPGLATVGDLIAWLQTRSPGHAAAFDQKNRIRCAVDQEFAGLDTPITTAREIAFFPPVTGG